MNIIKSLFITSAISALFGFGLSGLLGFWQSFCIAFATQLVLSFMYSSWKISREQLIIDNFQEEIDGLLDMSSVVVECPCGKNKFESPVFVGTENVFECEQCGNKFKAEVNITPTLLTEPVDISKTFDTLVNEKEQ